MKQSKDYAPANESRRNFFIKAGQTGSAFILGMTLAQFLEACQNATEPNAPELPKVQGSLAAGVVTVTVDPNSVLTTVGNAALVQYGSGSLLTFRSGQNTFLAVTSVCTHQQCTVSGFENQEYVCPCHGSRFGTSGQVKKGPASSPLHTFATQFANKQLSITL